MALTRNLEQLRDAVQRTADVVAFTDKHPAAYINDLVNRGLGALARLCRTVDPEFQPIASTTITFDGIATTWPLPSAFRSLISLEYIQGANGSGFKTWLLPYERWERAALTQPNAIETPAPHAHAYRLMGSNIEFLPLPPEGDTALLWYATTATQLSGDSSVFDTLERLDDYVIWWAAREIAMERENWERHDRLGQKIAEMEADIRVLARSRDLNGPARITDQRMADRDRYGRWRRAR